jgi:hypoxanthine phosphoribosyltransferase
MSRFDRGGIVAQIKTWKGVVALVVLVLEGIILAVLARSETVEWYVVLLGVTPLIVIIIGVFFGPIALQPRPTDNTAKNVRLLRNKLISERFQPDIIIGLSRGGLVVAAQLSRELGLNPPIPTISLWPHPNHNYDNAFNSFDLPRIYEMQRNMPYFGRKRVWNVLIIDDACNSGTSLSSAKKYVEQKLPGVRSRIVTAALEIKRGISRTLIEPDFFVSARTISRDAWGMDEE